MSVGLFGQTIYEPLTGGQRTLFHEPVNLPRPVNPDAGIARRFDADATGKLYPYERDFSPGGAILPVDLDEQCEADQAAELPADPKFRSLKRRAYVGEPTKAGRAEWVSLTELKVQP